MSSLPPPFNSSSMPPSGQPPIPSEPLLSNPSAQAFLIPRAASGRDSLVTLDEARRWFALGYTPLDPNTRQPVDVGPIPVPSFADEQGAFARQKEEEENARNAFAKEASKKGGLGGLGGCNGRNGDYHGGGPGAAGSDTAA